MKKKPVLAVLASLVVLAGCSHQMASPTTNPGSEPTAPPNVAGAPPPAAPQTPTPQTRVRQTTIYTVDLAHGTDADHYLVAQTIPISNPKHPAREALEALLRADHSPIPSGTRLLSVKISDGLAIVNFSRSPVDETQGEDQQAQALEAIQRTLGQFPNISRIQILVAGQPPASLGQAAGGPVDALRTGETLGNSGGA